MGTFMNAASLFRDESDSQARILQEIGGEKPNQDFTLARHLQQASSRMFYSKREEIDAAPCFRNLVPRVLGSGIIAASHAFVYYFQYSLSHTKISRNCLQRSPDRFSAVI
ncbi:MAG TPA: hypothetical protein VJS43_03195 [Candidatus Acidoferrales bacterium]|nr:hypothetical protein [Candidatus Acidoferrales bacterium]